MPKVLGIIPARLESTRLPGKLLLSETGKPLIVHTVEQALKCEALDKLIVATDSLEIAAVCKGLCPVFLTEIAHENGTSRCAEVADLMPEFTHVVNIQADEPEIDPDHIGSLVRYTTIGNLPTATLLSLESSTEGIENPNVVKAVVARDGNIMHFTRQPVRYSPDSWVRHIGVYAYDASYLKTYRRMWASPLEQAESLEQLRFLWHGIRMDSVFVKNAGHGVNTMEDYRAFCNRQARPAECVYILTPFNGTAPPTA